MKSSTLPSPVAEPCFSGLGGDSPQEILASALARWGRRVALLTSFQDEGMALLDMAWRIDPGVRVKTLDTGRLPRETYAMIDLVRERYKVEVEVFFPEARAVERLVRSAGPNLFLRSVEDRLACCRVRKVAPLKRALADLDAWITGLRREQSASRAEVAEVAADPENGDLVKLSPLAGWSAAEVEDYLREHDVPRHPLYAHGYASIGCAPCTRAVRAGEGPRAGRWWWEDDGHKECGLHFVQPDPNAGRPSLRVVR